MAPIQPGESNQPDWTDTIKGDVKANGQLHIWSTENAGAVITSDQYVRSGHDVVMPT